MVTTSIGLIAAMAEEIAPLLKTAERVEKVSRGRFTMYRMEIDGSSAWLVQSGMGERHAAAALEQLLATAAPAVIISFGFGGAVQSGLKVGDVVVGGASWRYAQQEFRQQEVSLPFTETLLAALQGGDAAGRLRCTRGEIITTAQLISKRELAGKLPPAMMPAVLDMETAAVAELAHRRGIPLVALRAISDDAAEELGFSLEELTDGELTIRLGKVLGTIARKPRIVPQLIRLARNSTLAGKNLARAVKETIAILGMQHASCRAHPLPGNE